MKLNCKPGDLAVVIRPTRRGQQLLGRIVKVLHAAPLHSFVLPDGFRNEGSDPGYWVIDLLGDIQVEIKFDSGTIGRRKSRYGSAPDSCLRPIRDNDQPDETLQWLEVPRKVAA